MNKCNLDKLQEESRKRNAGRIIHVRRRSKLVAPPKYKPSLGYDPIKIKEFIKQKLAS